jgi:hypothetical protein
LSLDSKQELSIDPRTVGLSDVDEMAFDFIKQKEVYMGTINWTEAQSSGTEIANYIVGPDWHLEDTINTYKLNLLAPMYTCAVPFYYWRGTIKIRFQIAASQLHRGRIRLTYDPYNTVAGSVPENEVYSRIIDLATNRDFEMCISWNSARPWLMVRDRLNDNLYSHSGAGSTTISPDYHNGEVRLEVVNELTSPDPALAQPVYINYFVSAGEDFEVAAPSDLILRKCEFEPQSGYEFEPHAGEGGEELIDEQDNVPESPAPVTPIGTESSPTDPNSHIFFGETFRSIRALLKRYCYHQAFGGEGGTEYYVVESNFPVEPGQSKFPRHTTGAGATPASTAYNYTQMTYLNWFTPCYIGWRGGLRSKYMLSNYSNKGRISVRRIEQPVSQNDCNVVTYDISQSNLSHLNEEMARVHNIGSGVEVVYPDVDGAAEVEFPFYSYKRFAHGRQFLDGSAGSSADNLGENSGHLVFTNAGVVNDMLRFVAAADDFSLFMWVGQPGIYYREKPDSGTSVSLKPIY